MKPSSIDAEWQLFLEQRPNEDDDDTSTAKYADELLEFVSVSKNAGAEPAKAPEPSDIYISTKSKIAYLTAPVDLKLFWDIPVIPYATPSDGVVKKQIKFNSASVEELNLIQERLKKELYFEEQIITSINNPNGRIKFKDIRKVTIGLSKKDIMTYRSRKRQAFYNCFVLILRIRMPDLMFKEFHVKVFNTGKLEIPGIQSDYEFETVLAKIVEILQPLIEQPLYYNKTSDTVLINSNFSCGFFIDRDVLFETLKFKYKIQCIYDPCSYPGIQCKFYYDKRLPASLQTGIALPKDAVAEHGVEVSFMIFRTGSVLIVGMCEENVLFDVYHFLSKLLKEEYVTICQMGDNAAVVKNNKKRKTRRRTVDFDDNVHHHHLDEAEPQKKMLKTSDE